MDTVQQGLLLSQWRIVSIIGVRSEDNVACEKVTDHNIIRQCDLVQRLAITTRNPQPVTCLEILSAKISAKLICTFKRLE